MLPSVFIDTNQLCGLSFKCFNTLMSYLRMYNTNLEVLHLFSNVQRVKIPFYNTAFPWQRFHDTYMCTSLQKACL